MERNETLPIPLVDEKKFNSLSVEEQEMYRDEARRFFYEELENNPNAFKVEVGELIDNRYRDITITINKDHFNYYLGERAREVIDSMGFERVFSAPWFCGFDENTKFKIEDVVLGEWDNEWGMYGHPDIQEFTLLDVEEDHILLNYVDKINKFTHRIEMEGSMDIQFYYDLFLHF